MSPSRMRGRQRTIRFPDGVIAMQIHKRLLWKLQPEGKEPKDLVQDVFVIEFSEVPNLW